MVPTPLIMVPLLAAFVLALLQYYVASPERRFLDPRFVVMAVSIALLAGYPIYSALVLDDRRTSWIFLCAAAICLCVAVAMLLFLPRRRI